MHAKLYIPKKMSLGQQNRAGTFTGKLGFLNPHDEKDRPKFKASWENWRDKKIPVKVIDNEPREGFVINKNAGGKYSGWYWDSGREAKIRVWDPLGFEFEITIPNMLWILEQTNSFKGKGLEGKMVYGWNGSTVVLVPIESEEYKGSMDFTDLKYQKVSSKEITPGMTVLTKDQETLIFIGKYEITKRPYYYLRTFTVGKEMIFYDPNRKEYRQMVASKIAKIIDSEITGSFADLVERFEKNNVSFARKRFEFIKAAGLKTNAHSRYERKVPPEEEITNGMLFVKEGETRYKGYRVFQRNKAKTVTYGSGKSAYQYQDGWEAEEMLKVTNPFDVEISGGVNKIIPGKEEDQDMKLSMVNLLDSYHIQGSVPDLNGKSAEKCKLG